MIAKEKETDEDDDDDKEEVIEKPKDDEIEIEKETKENEQDEIKVVESAVTTTVAKISAKNANETDLKLQYEDYKIYPKSRLNLALTLKDYSWNMRYAELPENNLTMFLANRSQYHRLGTNGHIQEYSLNKCQCCDFKYPVNNYSYNTSNVSTLPIQQQQLSQPQPMQQQQQQPPTRLLHQLQQSLQNHYHHQHQQQQHQLPQKSLSCFTNNIGTNINNNINMQRGYGLYRQF